MIRKIKPTDRDFYINSVKAFYNSDAVLHDIPTEHITKTFDESVSYTHLNNKASILIMLICIWEQTNTKNLIEKFLLSI